MGVVDLCFGSCHFRNLFLLAFHLLVSVEALLVALVYSLSLKPAAKLQVS